MKNLFHPSAADETCARLASLRPDSPRQWGTMTPAQVLAHCSRAMEMAVGDRKPKRMFIGRFVGPFIKRLAIGDESPLRRNTPTAPDLVVSDNPDFPVEQRRLETLVRRFADGGPQAATTHPHTFFGSMTPDEWSVLMYKHLDHHLRQFGA
jgi:hypothetical protein